MRNRNKLKCIGWNAHKTQNANRLRGEIWLSNNAYTFTVRFVYKLLAFFHWIRRSAVEKVCTDQHMQGIVYLFRMFISYFVSTAGNPISKRQTHTDPNTYARTHTHTSMRQLHFWQLYSVRSRLSFIKKVRKKWKRDSFPTTKIKSSKFLFVFILCDQFTKLIKKNRIFIATKLI